MFFVLITWITEVETNKTADWGYIRLYDYRPKFVSAGLGCDLDCMLSLSAMTAAFVALYINDPYLYLLTAAYTTVSSFTMFLVRVHVSYCSAQQGL